LVGPAFVGPALVGLAFVGLAFRRTAFRRPCADRRRAGPASRRPWPGRPAARPPGRSATPARTGARPARGTALLGAALLLAVLPGALTPAPARAAPGDPPAAPPTGLRPVAPRSGFGWPLAPPHPVLRPFDPPASRYGPGHRGVDLGAPAGQPVLASAEGVVVYAGPLAGRPVVSVEHAGGLRTTYEPVLPAVTAGQRVRRGQPIGFLLPGHPGCASGASAPGGGSTPGPQPAGASAWAPGSAACLHWGVRRGEQYLDPLRLVLSHVRLLPWRDVAG
jgi:murein DD-endopeptidase MepM/ murein hydrolase activator NlpD